MQNQQTKPDCCNNAVVWFVVLEQARQKNDFERAAKAKRELERLGVVVKYRKVKRHNV